MGKKLFLLAVLLCINAFNGDFVLNSNAKDYIENVVPTEVIEQIEEPIEEIVIENYTLKSSFAYYKGSLDMSEITKVVFTKEKPLKYDEKWYANLTDTEDLMGYRDGTVVYVVGERIYFNPRSAYLFAAENSYGDKLWYNLKEIEGLDFVNTSLMTNCSLMFYKNMGIKELNLESWDMSNVRNVSFMFAGCLNLEKLYVSSWDVSKVEDFSAFLQGNSHKGDMKLSYIDVSKWDTRSAKKMGHTFYGCGSLEYIDVSNWNVEKVTTFTHMFSDCFKLKSIDLSGWNTYSVDSFDAFLNDCRSLKVVDISGLETGTCRQFSQMFEACIVLEEIIGIEDLDVSNASYYSFSEMFHYCQSLKSLDLSKWDTRKADNYARMFAYCDKLEYLNLTGFQTVNLKYVTEMFVGTTNVKVIGMDNWNLNGVKGVESMYYKNT